jgi:hypothetical protein
MTGRIRTAALAGVVAAVLAAGVPAAPAQDAPVTARGMAKKVLAAYQDAVVTVKAAVKMQGGFGGGDQQMELTGTVVDPSGLTVVSESGLDPMAMFGAMMGGGEEDSPFGHAETGDVKIVMKDGKEIPSRLVLRDKDLDLAFIVPEEKGLKMTFLPLETGKALEALDDLIILGRLGKNLDRTATVGVSTVAAVVKKPRTFYVTDSASAMLELGCPAFDGAGKPVGILLKRRAPGGGGFADLIRGMMPVILPCDDVKEVAKQALEEAAKPPKEKKEAAPPAPEGEGEKKPEDGAKDK